MTGWQAQRAEPYVQAARAAGADAVVRVVEEHTEEIFARDGGVEFDGNASESRVGLQLLRDGRCAFVTAPLDADPAALVARALAVADLLPDTGATLAAADLVDRDGAEPVASLGDCRDILLMASATGSGAQCEIRCVHKVRRVRLTTTAGATATYRTTRASVEVRCTYGSDGRVATVSETDCAATLDGVLERLRSATRRCLERAQALTMPAAAGALPRTVVLDGYVAAQLLKFMVGAFSAEAVAQGRSRLADMLGRPVAASMITITDDPVAVDLPMTAPFDDEGEPARRRDLVVAGNLTGYLGSRRYARSVPGSLPGSAWQQSPTTPPRPSARNLWIQPTAAPVPADGPRLRIIQTRGMYTSNDVTGDFSMGATGLVERSGELLPASDITVAGNVFEVLRNVRAVGDELRWSAGSAGGFASPDLLVEGLAVGR